MNWQFWKNKEAEKEEKEAVPDGRQAKPKSKLRE